MRLILVGTMVLMVLALLMPARALAAREDTVLPAQTSNVSVQQDRDNSWIAALLLLLGVSLSGGGAGNGQNPNPDPQGVPEPAAILLLGLAGAPLIARWVRERR